MPAKLRGIFPVLVLALLSPMIAEYLSGSLPLSQLNAIPVLLLIYGAGTVLIRESARRFHRGWPTIIVLAMAYAIAEEGIGDQSLFNAGWHNLHLLDSGYVPSLGIGMTWTIYVLTIHVIWSIAVPIVLTETLFADRNREPWLGRIGLVVTFLLYVLGISALTLYSVKFEHFSASPAQLAASATVIALLVAAAFAMPPTRTKATDAAPSPWLVGAVTFMATNALTLIYGHGVKHWPWLPVSGGLIAIIAIVSIFAFVASHRSGWTQTHTYAMATGPLLVYCWLGFPVEIALHGRSMLMAHAVLAAFMVGIVVLAGIRVSKAGTNLRADAASGAS